MDELIKPLGITSASKSKVSPLREEIDERVDAFLNRPIEGDWRDQWIDSGDVLKVRRNGRIVSVANIIAVGVDTMGAASAEHRYRPLGGRAVLDRAPPQAQPLQPAGRETGDFENPHERLKAAIPRVFCASWRRCRMRLMRNALRPWPARAGAASCRP